MKTYATYRKPARIESMISTMYQTMQYRFLYAIYAIFVVRKTRKTTMFLFKQE